MEDFLMALPFIILMLGLVGAVAYDEYLTYKYCKMMGQEYRFFRWGD